MRDLVTVEVFKESDFDILSSKDYANFAKSDKVNLTAMTILLSKRQ